MEGDLARPRIAYVIGQLVQNGAERYTVELLAASDRTRFDLTVIAPPDVTGHYYFRVLQDRGIPVRLAEFRQSLVDPAQATAFRRILDEYDLVAVIQIETYHLIQVAVDHSRLVVHLLSTIQQYFPVDPYRCLSPRLRYNFVGGNPLQLVEIEHPLKGDFRWFWLPSVIDIDNAARPEWPDAVRDGDRVRLATVTRLSLEKPMEPYLIAFHCLLQTHPQAALFVYGDGDRSLYERLIRVLGLADRVHFRGHQASLEQALVQDEISLVLCDCYGDGLGYAAMQLGGQGFPIAFWDMSQHRLPSADRPFPRFRDVPGYVAQIARWLNDPAALRAHAQTFRDYVRRTHSPPGRIRELEDFYLDIMHGHAADRRASRFTTLQTTEALTALGGPIVIYGTGDGGNRLHALAQGLGLDILAFARSEAAGTFKGLPIVPLPDLPDRFAPETRIIIASEFYLAIAHGLEDAGFRRVYNALPLLRGADPVADRTSPPGGP